MNRRQMLHASGLAALGLGLRWHLPAAEGGPVPRTAAPAPGPFQHRYLLGWVNDNSSRARAGQRWPMVEIDETTVADYETFFQVARDCGYNGITLWGLFATHAWAVPLEKSVTSERKRQVERILAAAGRTGIKVLYGLGVYSWGFEEIIRYDPTTARNEGRMAWGTFQPDNGVAMCYQSPSARQWMRAIVDLCVREAGTQGFGFQSGDLGRCYCQECRRLSDTEYHTRVIGETAAYVRDRHPGQILGLSAWGVDLGGGAASLTEIGRHLDFLTDVTDQSARRGGHYRRALAAALPCALGSLGGAVVVPPQRWARDRWFLPHPAMAARSIRSLHADGGRAFEFFMGPLANPQFNLMIRFVGLLLTDPTQTCEQALAHVLEDLCAPDDPRTRAALVQWVLAAETAYFSRAGDVSSGEFDFEPLKGETAGAAIYLTRLPAQALADYAADLRRLAGELPALEARCHRPAELGLIRRCLANVLADIGEIQATRDPPATKV